MNRIICLMIALTAALVCGPNCSAQQAVKTTFDGVQDSPSALSQAGDIDTTFNAGVFNPGTVLQMARQPDGKVVVAGRFPIINGVARNRIARLNADGTLDLSFNPAPEIFGDILSLALQPDGKILIGGDSLFNYNNPNVFQGDASFGRLNADGSLDTAFIPGITNNPVLAIQALSNGKILVGGVFTRWFTPNGFVARDQLVRVNADGSLDNSFITDILAPTGRGIFSMAVQPDGRIVIAGNFNGVNGGPGGNVNPGLARLNADGTRDDTTGFNVGSGPLKGNGLSSFTLLWDVALQTDGKIIVGGYFDSFNGTARAGVARLNADGSLDSSFNGPGIGQQGHVFAVALQLDGKVVIGGDDGATTNPTGRFRRLNADGSLDTSFDTGELSSIQQFSSPIFDIALEPSGKILTAGRFFRYKNEGHISLARVNADASVDSSYNAGAFVVGTVREIAFQPDNKILIGGDFMAVNGISRTNMARINADGSLDTTFFTSETDSTVRAICVQPDGKILVGGNLGSRLLRLNADGSRDATFNINGALINRPVWDIVLQPNGQILVGGEFGGGIARLEANGAATDQQFFVNYGLGANDTVRSILLQPDGTILLAGLFTTFKSVSRPGLERLNGNGLPDSSFTPGLPAGLNDSIALQTDGKVIVGGRDRIVNGKRAAIFRVNSDGSLDNAFDATTWLIFGSVPFAEVTAVGALANGKVLFGGTFVVNGGSAGTLQRVYRVLADGSPDNSFTSAPGGNAPVLSFAMQPDGKLIVGGQFTTYNSQQYFGVLRLFADGGPTPTPTPTPTPDFIVNSTRDPGTGVCDVTECTFREALNAVNAKPGRETIAFNIPGSGVRTISFTSQLPQIDSEVVIDGYTQPGASPNTLSMGDNAVLLIELAGPLGGNNGLAIAGANSVLKGLVINRLGDGITLFSNDNVVQGNFIGTDATGTLDRGNSFHGVGIFGSSSFNLIGGTDPGARNIISGNRGNGVFVNSGQSQMVVGNLIGTKADGFSPLGNTQQGILFLGTGNNTAGGLGSGAGNIIAFNGGNAGVSVGPSSTKNAIIGNSIFSNAGLGINLGADGPQANDSCDADTGSNGLQNFPVLTSAVSTASNTTIQGTLNSTASTTFRVEFFVNSACDASGFGEGKTFIGSTTIITGPSCNASINVTLPISNLSGQVIVATATDSNNNTSEFSQCGPVTEATPNVSVSGRVITPDGRGLRNATVFITDSNGVRRTATTSSFGFYSFDGVQTGQNYTMGVSSRLYRFATQTVSVSGDLTNIDFVGLE